MIVLSTEDSIIQVALGAAAAPDLRWSASYVKVQNTYSSSPQVQQDAVTAEGQTNGVTPVDVTPAIDDTNYWIRLTGFYIRNSGAGTQTVIVRQNGSGGAFNILQSISLDSGSHLIYNEESGWDVKTSAGASPSPGSGVYLEVANNLSDVASALTSFNNIKQPATEVFAGVAEIATQAETDTGVDDTRFVTPLKFQTRLAAYAQPLDTDLTAIAGLAPSNDDIIQRKAGAWTNRTIAQYYADLQPSVKDDVYLTIPFIPVNFSPADATTYYFGNSVIGTVATNVVCRLGYDVTVIGAIINATSNTTAGTTETGTMNLRNVTDGTSSLISNTVRTDGSSTVIRTQTATGLSINVDAADDICLEFIAPTWATNPVSLIFRVILICKRR